MRTAVPKAAIWTLVFVVVLASLIPLTAASSSSTYTLYGYAYQPGTGSPVPGGVTVDLTSSATGQTYTTTTAVGGSFLFASGTNAPNLAPGTWGVSIPIQTNATLAGCGPYPCAVIPNALAPVYTYQSSGNLTSNGATFVTLRNINVLQYNATLNGTVTYLGVGARGATVEILDPSLNNVVLASNGTNSRGFYTMEVPAGNWVLQTILPGPTVRYNTSAISISEFSSATRNVVVQNYLIQGSLTVGSGGAAPNGVGNVTVYDPANGYIYSSSTPASGFYSFGTYTNLTTRGTQPFDVFLSSTNATTAWYAVNVTNGNPVTRNVQTTPLQTSQKAVYNTVLNFTGFNVTIGNGSLQVTTNAVLGNNSVLQTLPNATIGQLWAQLGLDFSHSLTLSSAQWSNVVNTINATGAFFPAIAAGTTINGTTFTTSYRAGGQPSYAFSATSPCSTVNCGPSSTASINLNYSQSYALSGSVVAKSPAYTISFNALHPSSRGVYTYEVVLPAGYILKAGTAPPTDTTFSANGPGGTWSSFLVTSLPSTSTYSTLNLPIVKAGGVTPIVNVTASNFGFSSANVLNSTSNNYTVVLGPNINATFSALNSIFPAGTNGTYYSWNFGDDAYSNSTSTATTYEYPTASATTPYQGTLTVRSSGGTSNVTNFTVWVAPAGHVQANLSYNVTGASVRSAAGEAYLYLNWSGAVTFNATYSSANVSEPLLPGVLSVALFSVQTTSYTKTQNNSVSQGASFTTPFSISFLGNGKYYNTTVINGVTITNFLGWRYFVNLSVWSGAGSYSKVSLIVLVNDTQAPKSAFSLLNSAGKYITTGSIIEGSNQTAQIVLNGANATDPNNGSIVKYQWNITNSNTTFHFTNITQNATAPSYKYPGRVSVWLAPQTAAYTLNLTVWDRAGNVAWSTQTLTVAPNSTTRPIMAANNFTGPSSLTQGSSYTYWLNITTGGGSKAVGMNINVTFYLLSPSGTGSRQTVGSPSQVQFFNYTNGVLNTTVAYTGTYPSLAYNKTIRAQITWSPGPVGNWNLYANVSASNEYAGDYVNGPQTAVLSISVNANSLTQTLIYVAIAVAVIAVIVLLYVFWYRPRHRGGKPTSGKSGLERGSKGGRSSKSDDSS